MTEKNDRLTDGSLDLIHKRKLIKIKPLLCVKQ